MTLSPHKHVSCGGAPCRSGSSQRGVEAKELELGATRLDLAGSDDLNLNIDGCHSPREQLTTTRSRPAEEDDFSAMSNSTSAMCTEDTGSFIQVVVKKHHSRKDTLRTPNRETQLQHNAVQTSPAVASSAIHILASGPVPTTCGAGDNLTVTRAGNVRVDDAAHQSLYMMPHPVILAAYPPQYMCQSSKTLVDVATSARSSSSFKKIIRKDFSHKTTPPPAPPGGEASDGHHIDTRLPGGSRRWLQDALGRFKMKTIQPTEPSPEKIELYYFDRGSREYYATTDCAPLTLADRLAERAETHATRFWAEVFGVPLLALTFLTAFLLQLERFILYGVFRPLIVGVIQILSDYLLKPSLAVLFNALIQPPLLFLFNVLTSLRDVCRPLAECVGHFLQPVQGLVGSLRLVQVTNATDKCTHNV